MKLTLTFRGQAFDVELTETDGAWTATVNDVAIPVRRSGNQIIAGGTTHSITTEHRQAWIDGNPEPFHIRSLQGVAGALEEAGGKHGPIKPPMTGKLDQLLVSEGDEVSKGTVLFVLEAMKMRNEIKAPVDGIIGPVVAKVGDAVDSSHTILELLPA
ncbi:MAG: biotin/lipoyl-containing protein [Thermoplasmatota archaeon]